MATFLLCIDGDGDGDVDVDGDGDGDGGDDGGATKVA